MKAGEEGQGLVKELSNFYAAIREDQRIGSTHISVYMALFQLYNMNSFTNPIAINRKQVMESAKISGLATYHKCLKDLVELGYIFYQPSFNPTIPSLIYLLKI